MRATDNRLAFVIAVAIKWGGPLWLCFVLGRITYRYLFGSFSFDRDLLGYTAFSLLFCLGVGCIMGALKLRAEERLLKASNRSTDVS